MSDHKDIASHAGGRDVPVATDLSKRLRAMRGFGPEDFDLLTQAAEEIERYYGGMMNWKATAQEKDGIIIELRERLAATPSTAAVRAAALEEAANAVASTNTLGMTAPAAITKLCAAIRALSTSPSTQVGDVGRDAARLDYVLSNDAFIVAVGVTHKSRYQLWNQDEDENHHVLSGPGDYATRREAIDAAMSHSAHSADGGMRGEG